MAYRECMRAAEINQWKMVGKGSVFKSRLERQNLSGGPVNRAFRYIIHNGDWT